MNYSFYCIGPDDVLRLRDEHSFLERQLAEIIVLAAANRAKDCGASWELFTSELQRHMQYEENLFFPAFAKIGAAERLRSEQFRVEHEELRLLCHRLSSALAQPSLNLELLRELAARLAFHKEQEGLVLYPWLGSLAPYRPSWEVMRLVVTPSSASPELR